MPQNRIRGRSRGGTLEVKLWLPGKRCSRQDRRGCANRRRGEPRAVENQSLELRNSDPFGWVVLKNPGKDGIQLRRNWQN